MPEKKKKSVNQARTCTSTVGYREQHSLAQDLPRKTQSRPLFNPRAFSISPQKRFPLAHSSILEHHRAPQRHFWIRGRSLINILLPPAYVQWNADYHIYILKIPLRGHLSIPFFRSLKTSLSPSPRKISGILALPFPPPAFMFLNFLFWSLPIPILHIYTTLPVVISLWEYEDERPVQGLPYGGKKGSVRVPEINDCKPVLARLLWQHQLKICPGGHSPNLYLIFAPLQVPPYRKTFPLAHSPILKHHRYHGRGVNTWSQLYFHERWHEHIIVLPWQIFK